MSVTVAAADFRADRVISAAYRDRFTGEFLRPMASQIELLPHFAPAWPDIKVGT
jgi:hypothetical protein